VIGDSWEGEVAQRTAGMDPPQRRLQGIGAGPRATVDRGYWRRFLVAHSTLILLITAAVTAGAAAVSALQTPVYRAQAEVAVYPPSSAGSSTAFVMGTEKGIASSGAVLSIASDSLLIPVSKLQRGVTISIPVDSDLLVVSFSDPNPQLAQSAAETIAQAYVIYRAPKSATPAPNGAAATPVAVSASVITDAQLPTSPVSPNRGLDLGVGMVIGLALGLGLALLRDAIDDRLRGALDLQSQADAPVLAQIPAFHGKKGSSAERLAVVRSPGSAAAEAYRNLRTRILQLAAGRHASVLIVTSPGREEKTTVAANLAAALALSGRKVVLICADLRWGRTRSLFGWDDRFGWDTRLGLTNLLYGDTPLVTALRETEVPGLRVLPGGPVVPGASTATQLVAFRQLLAQLRSRADFVVIDAPPVLASADTGALAELGAMILLVGDARRSTRAEVRAATQELRRVGDDLAGCVLDNIGRARRLPEASESSNQITTAIPGEV
jgi:succinoglycan biosynthesis transport protein ExoP